MNAKIKQLAIDLAKAEHWDLDEESALFTLDREKTAKRLCKMGYIKQSEGEWIKHSASYECTVCNEEFYVEGYAEDYDPISDYDLHFCPNCGAHMKDGAE